ncbi:hypothetical protein [Helicobacter bizzozeronii]|uniref:hypothetical protein n=1 Tax=Helicobacter bizzozeronii TaxID=56877 RepID=UPI0018F859AF|nr:hypothetical protein [Helicobacter bizzozeronii]
MHGCILFSPSPFDPLQFGGLITLASGLKSVGFAVLGDLTQSFMVDLGASMAGVNGCSLNFSYLSC